jgi:hypothetical protein
VIEWRPNQSTRPPSIREFLRATPAEWLASVFYTVCLILALTVVTELLR